jgi:hypothetical protein
MERPRPVYVDREDLNLCVVNGHMGNTRCERIYLLLL